MSVAGRKTVRGGATLSKFVAVLQIIGDSPRELSVSELCKVAKLPRGTVYRIVDALCAEGLVDDTQVNRKLALGPRLISLAARSWAASDLRTLAHEEIKRLRDATGETVHLAVPSGLEMVYIDKRESPQTVRMTSRIGTRISLHASSVGKAYLAALPDKERRDLVAKLSLKRFTANTITSRAKLEADLERTIKRGYALDFEETELEIQCVGAVIRDAAGRPMACISVSVPKYRFNRAVEARLPETVVECANKISSQLDVSETL